MVGAVHLPIHTPRLILREFVAGDLDAVYAYVSDPEVVRYMFYGPLTRLDTQQYLANRIEGQCAVPRMVWEVAVQTNDGDLIGACDLTCEKAEEADLGFILARHAWGQGYGTEIARALVRVGFEQLGVRRIVATCDIANVASSRVLNKAGLRREALLEKHRFIKNRWWTSHFYALDRDRSRASGGDCGSE